MVPCSNDEYVIRPAGAHDAQLVAIQRASMFRDMGSASAEESELPRRASEPWLSGHLTNGDDIGWLVEHGGIVVAGEAHLCRGVRARSRVLSSGSLGANLYTEPTHGRRGLARRLVKTILGWCKVHDIDHVTLSASDEGRPLYESLGFKTTSDMSLSK